MPLKLVSPNSTQLLRQRTNNTSILPKINRAVVIASGKLPGTPTQLHSVRTQLVEYLNSDECHLFTGELTVNGSTLDCINEQCKSFKHTQHATHTLPAIAVCTYLQSYGYKYSTANALLQHIKSVMHIYSVAHKLYKYNQQYELFLDISLYMNSTRCTLFQHIKNNRIVLTVQYIEQLMQLQQQYNINIIDTIKRICIEHSEQINTLRQLLELIESNYIPITHTASLTGHNSASTPTSPISEPNNENTSFNTTDHNHHNTLSLDNSTIKLNVSVVPATPCKHLNAKNTDTDIPNQTPHRTSISNKRSSADQWLDSVHIQSYIHSPAPVLNRGSTGSRSNPSSKRNSALNTPGVSPPLTPLHSSVAPITPDTELQNLLHAIDTINTAAESATLRAPLGMHEHLFTTDTELHPVTPPTNQRSVAYRRRTAQKDGITTDAAGIETAQQSIDTTTQTSTDATTIPITDDMHTTPTKFTDKPTISQDNTWLPSPKTNEPTLLVNPDTILAAAASADDFKSIDPIKRDSMLAIDRELEAKATAIASNNRLDTTVRSTKSYELTVDKPADDPSNRRATLRASQRQTLKSAQRRPQNSHTPIESTNHSPSKSIHKRRHSSRRESAKHFRLPSEVLLGEVLPNINSAEPHTQSLVTYSDGSSDDISSDEETTKQPTHHARLSSVMIRTSKLLNDDDSYHAKYVLPNKQANELPPSSMNALLRSLRAGPKIDDFQDDTLGQLDEQIQSLRVNKTQNMFTGLDDTGVAEATKLIRQKSWIDTENTLIAYDEPPISPTGNNIRFKSRVGHNYEDTSNRSSSTELYGFVMNVNVTSDTGTVKRIPTFATNIQSADDTVESHDSSTDHKDRHNLYDERNTLQQPVHRRDTSVSSTSDLDFVLSKRANDRSAFFQADNGKYLGASSPLTSYDYIDTLDLMSARTKQLLQPIMDENGNSDAEQEDLNRLKQYSADDLEQKIDDSTDVVAEVMELL